MRLTIVVENHTVSQKLLAEWGYCAWLETEAGVVLLDTGGISHTLTHNLAALKLDAGRIRHLALSHGHFDHTSGLTDILRLKPDVHIWAAPSIGRPRLSGADAGRASGGGALLAGLAFTPVAPTADILPGVTAFTVPQSERDPRWVCTKNLFEKTEDGRIAPDSFEDDLSLLVRTEKGASVLLGCAHAGLPNILGYAARHFGIDRFEAVIGGTHLSSVAREDYPAWMAELVQYNVRRWRPCHCTGFAAAAELARRFNDVDWASAGTVHEL